MEYRLLAVDMDGTVLNSEKKISHRTDAAIRKAMTQGKEVLFATGRCPAEVRRELKIYPEMSYVLCLSGALVLDLKKGKAMTNVTIPRSLTERILAEQGEAVFGQAELLPHLLAQFVIECIRSVNRKKREKKEKPVPEERFVTHAMQEENALLVIDEIFLYDYRDITLPELAKRLGFSVRQTQRLLERIYGKSFTRKKLEARMSAAMTLLRNSRYSITEISEQLGYSSMEHFSCAFAKYYGYVPSKIRKGSTEENGGVSGRKR